MIPFAEDNDEGPRKEAAAEADDRDYEEVWTTPGQTAYRGSIPVGHISGRESRAGQAPCEPPPTGLRIALRVFVVIFFFINGGLSLAGLPHLEEAIDLWKSAYAKDSDVFRAGLNVALMLLYLTKTVSLVGIWRYRKLWFHVYVLATIALVVVVLGRSMIPGRLSHDAPSTAGVIAVSLVELGILIALVGVQWQFMDQQGPRSTLSLHAATAQAGSAGDSPGTTIETGGPPAALRVALRAYIVLFLLICTLGPLSQIPATQKICRELSSRGYAALTGTLWQLTGLDCLFGIVAVISLVGLWRYQRQWAYMYVILVVVIAIVDVFDPLRQYAPYAHTLKVTSYPLETSIIFAVVHIAIVLAILLPQWRFFRPAPPGFLSLAGIRANVLAAVAGALIVVVTTGTLIVYSTVNPPEQGRPAVVDDASMNLPKGPTGKDHRSTPPRRPPRKR